MSSCKYLCSSVYLDNGLYQVSLQVDDGNYGYRCGIADSYGRLVLPCEYYSVTPLKDGSFYYAVQCEYAGADGDDPVFLRGILKADGTPLTPMAEQYLWWWDNGYQIFDCATEKNSWYTWDGAQTDRYTATGRSRELYERFSHISELGGGYFLAYRQEDGTDLYTVLDADFRELLPLSVNWPRYYVRSGRAYFVCGKDVYNGEGKLLLHDDTEGYSQPEIAYTGSGSTGFTVISTGDWQNMQYHVLNEAGGEFFVFHSSPELGERSPSGAFTLTADDVTLLVRDGEVLRDYSGKGSSFADSDVYFAGGALRSPEGEILMEASEVWNAGDGKFVVTRSGDTSRTYGLYDANQGRLTIPMEAGSLITFTPGIFLRTSPDGEVTALSGDNQVLAERYEDDGRMFRAFWYAASPERREKVKWVSLCHTAEDGSKETLYADPLTGALAPFRRDGFASNVNTEGLYLSLDEDGLYQLCSIDSQGEDLQITEVRVNGDGSATAAVRVPSDRLTAGARLLMASYTAGGRLAGVSVGAAGAGDNQVTLEAAPGGSLAAFLISEDGAPLTRAARKPVEVA